MNKYTELKETHRKMVNEFPMAFAFSNEQFVEAKKKLGVESNDELLSIPGGGMIRKTDKESYEDLLRTINREAKEALADDEYLYQGIIYELGNHEYCITYDPTEALAVMGLSEYEIVRDERMAGIYKKAKADYLEASW